MIFPCFGELKLVIALKTYNAIFFDFHSYSQYRSYKRSSKSSVITDPQRWMIGNM